MKKKLIFLCSVLFVFNLHAQNWLTTGNAGLAGTNFIGTTDAIPFVIKVNNQQAGLIDFSSTLANTSFGFQALKNNTTGNNNAAFGYKAAFLNTTGIFNTALGPYALTFNTTGYSNVAVGVGALYRNKTRPNLVAVGDSALYNNGSGVLSANDAYSNTAIGSKSLYTNTKGSNNTAVGARSLYANLSGLNNTAIGNVALFSNTTGNYNTAFGSNSLVLNQTGSNNTAVGYFSLTNNTASFVTAVGYGAMYKNTSGSFNVSSGCFSMYNNTTGGQNCAYGYSALTTNGTGYQNTAIGEQALFNNSTGAGNDAHGKDALYNNMSGSNNVAVGVDALYDNTVGNYNTALGANALYGNTSSYYNTAVGFFALAYAGTPGYNNVAVGAFSGPDVNTEGVFNSVAVGEQCYISASNQARIGNSSTTSIGGYANWTNISDGRVKKNIKENVPGLAFINKLKPVTYNLNLDAADKIIQVGERKDENGKIIPLSANELQSRNVKEQILYTGFVAQDVEKAAKELSYDFSGVDAAKNDKDLYGLRYAEFVVPLVKAVQELDENQKSEVKSQKEEIEELKKQINELKTLITGTAPQTTNNAVSSQTVVLSTTPSLDQNIPNPFAGVTIINCNVPVNNGNTYLNFYNQTGALLKSVKITGTGKNSITLKANELASGTYKYALLIDGKLIDTKQMILAK